MTAPSRRTLLAGALAGSLILAAEGRARAAGQALRVVASSVPHAEILHFVSETLAPDVPLQVIEISGDLRPNALLRDGDADANFFQHVPFLRAEEAAMGTRFAVVATVHVEPLGLYSRRARALADLPKGGTVALPNNVTNASRSLTLLQENGLIRLRPGGAGIFASTDDIAENPKGFRFVEIAPPQLPRALDDVALAVINGNYALEAGLEPARDALALERAEGNPYANVLVTTQALAGDPRIQRAGRAPDLGRGRGFHPDALPRLRGSGAGLTRTGTDRQPRSCLAGRPGRRPSRGPMPDSSRLLTRVLVRFPARPPVPSPHPGHDLGVPGGPGRGRHRGAGADPALAGGAAGRRRSAGAPRPRRQRRGDERRPAGAGGLRPRESDRRGGPRGRRRRLCPDRDGQGGPARPRFWLAAQGITAFVLTYRLPREGWTAGALAPLQDGQRALRLIRAGAARFRIDPARLGVLGFSAGGHLAGCSPRAPPSGPTTRSMPPTTSRPGPTSRR